MANASKYGYKTGTFITKIIFFKFVYNFVYSAYVIYDVKETKMDMQLSLGANLLAFWLKFAFILSCFGRREVKKSPFFGFNIGK